MEPLERKIGYGFRNGILLGTALTHSSYANENRNEGLSSNERLEFLGDSILGLIVADFLYQRYPWMPEGRMTRLRAELVCEQSLVHVAHELGLGAYIRLGRGEDHSGGRERQSILADAVEAVIAALYLDGGMDVARAFVESRILAALGTEEPAYSSDYKTALQELVQRRSGQVLSYAMLAESGPDHSKTFTAEVRLNDVPIGEGSGSTKKEAEQNAARAAMRGMEA
jgi:ribonuclease-3